MCAKQAFGSDRPEFARMGREKVVREAFSLVAKYGALPKSETYPQEPLETVCIHYD